MVPHLVVGLGARGVLVLGEHDVSITRRLHSESDEGAIFGSGGKGVLEVCASGIHSCKHQLVVVER